MEKNLNKKNTFINKVIIAIIRTYQKILSPDTGILKKIGFFRTQTCTFYPTCSEYAIGCFERFNIIKALFLSIKRILRCHPWQKEHIDLVPEK